MVKRLYFFTGLPCAGKTRAARLLASSVLNNCTVLSSGDIARKLMESDLQQAQMEATDLFPDESQLRQRLIQEIEATPGDVIIEGFPRSGDQVNFIVDNLWIYQPVIIEINVGDISTLINRAKFRSRDGRDTSDAFMQRLARASKNMTDVHTVVQQRLIPFYTILGGDDSSTIAQFKRLLRIK